MLFITTGAFVGLQQIVESRLGEHRHRIGFTPRPEETVESISDHPAYTALCQAQTRDLVAFGMIPEFIGRFATITVLHELSRGDLRDILSDKTERSPLETQRRLAAIHGIELEFDSESLDAIVAEAVSLGTGARGLARLIGRAVDSVDSQWAELANRGVGRVVIHRACIERGAPPELIQGKSSLRRIDLELREESLSGLPPRPRPVLSNGSPHGQTPPGITDVTGWSDERIWNSIETMKNSDLGWKTTTESARKWWESFEKENRHRPVLIHRLAEELRNRKATIGEIFLAYVYSNSDNIQANLHYLDYRRLKEADERMRK